MPARLIARDRARQAAFQRVYAVEAAIRRMLRWWNLLRTALAVLQWWR